MFSMRILALLLSLCCLNRMHCKQTDLYYCNGVQYQIQHHRCIGRKLYSAFHSQIKVRINRVGSCHGVDYQTSVHQCIGGKLYPINLQVANPLTQFRVKGDLTRIHGKSEVSKFHGKGDLSQIHQGKGEVSQIYGRGDLTQIHGNGDLNKHEKMNRNNYQSAYYVPKSGRSRKTAAYPTKTKVYPQAFRQNYYYLAKKPFTQPISNKKHGVYPYQNIFGHELHPVFKQRFSYGRPFSGHPNQFGFHQLRYGYHFKPYRFLHSINFAHRPLHRFGNGHYGPSWFEHHFGHGPYNHGEGHGHHYHGHGHYANRYPYKTGRSRYYVPRIRKKNPYYYKPYYYKKIEPKKPDGKSPDGKKPHKKIPDEKKPDKKIPDGNKPDKKTPDGNRPDNKIKDKTTDNLNVIT